MKELKVLVVIPARWASTRFPGKPLVEIHGKTMIRRVFEQVSQARGVSEIVVATDHAGIFDHARAFGAQARMTSTELASGTDRCAAVARDFPDVDIVLNVQGDEPFVQPAQLELLIGCFEERPDVQIATLVKKITEEAQIFNPNTVKAVFSGQGSALYFSRHPIPYLRGHATDAWHTKADYFKHIGLYGFRRTVLLELAELPMSSLEQAESLEQLRWLQHGYDIRVVQTDMETIGIDTPDDLARVNADASFS
jgi:3-deoxy-manno-octulosonate cytidylyltransferase (CMP-KDO synthetase)